MRIQKKLVFWGASHLLFFSLSIPNGSLNLEFCTTKSFFSQNERERESLKEASSYNSAVSGCQAACGKRSPPQSPLLLRPGWTSLLSSILLNVTNIVISA